MYKIWKITEKGISHWGSAWVESVSMYINKEAALEGWEWIKKHPKEGTTFVSIASEEVCCPAFGEALMNGSDSEGYGSLVSWSELGIFIGCGLKSINFCPWCGNTDMIFGPGPIEILRDEEDEVIEEVPKTEQSKYEKDDE